MKDNVNLFIVDEDDNLVINKIEVRKTKEYQAILMRDRGSKGDHEGRKKSMATKELLYMYMTIHPASIFRDLSLKEREIKSKTRCGLPDDWKPDKLLNLACKRFREDLDLSALHHSYINASRGVYGVGEDLAFFNNRREQLRANIKYKTAQLDKETDEAQQGILHKEIERDTEMLLSIGQKIIKMSNDLPIAFKTIEDLKKKLADESAKTKELYGGGTLGNRES